MEIRTTQNAQPTAEQLEQWADLLLKGIELQEGDVVGLKGQPCALALLNLLYGKIVQGGGIPIPLFQMPSHGRYDYGQGMALYGQAEMIDVPQWREDQYGSMTAFIEVLGDEEPGLLGDWPQETEAAISKAYAKLAEIRLKTRWILTMWPTEAEAKKNGMDYGVYADLVVGASVVDSKLMDKAMDPVQKAMAWAEQISISTMGPNGEVTLSMEIPNKAIKCTGENNHPDGELFTSPDPRTVNGAVYLKHRITTQHGEIIGGIFLQFTDGVITAYHAKEGQEALERIIETDDGAKRLGEVAMGFNDGFDGVVLLHPLFIEKVAGTFHIAIGKSYAHCWDEADLADAKDSGAFNESAHHVDLVGVPTKIVLETADGSMVEIVANDDGIFEVAEA